MRVTCFVPAPLKYYKNMVVQKSPYYFEQRVLEGYVRLLHGINYLVFNL